MSGKFQKDYISFSNRQKVLLTKKINFISTELENLKDFLIQDNIFNITLFRSYLSSIKDDINFIISTGKISTKHWWYINNITNINILEHKIKGLKC